MNTQITSIQELIDYLKIKKAEQEKLQKKNPDFSISLKSIEGLPVDLLFEIEAFITEGESYVSSYRKISFSNDKLSLYVTGKTFPMSVQVYSVKVKKVEEPKPTKEMYEVIPQ